MSEDLFKQIKGKLKSEYYLMNDDWLKDCIEFYITQHDNPSIQETLQFVKIQWQLSDLREINNENGSLPRNISQHKFIVLPEKYILQVEQMYDIATSKYKQLEQIRNITISESPDTEKSEKWAPPKKRMMQLRLTDGVQDIIGIEYNYIPWFNDMLLPGYKIMIVGPIKCRKGVLLLEEGKLKGIGGEVDSLLIPNAVENILARALNLKENPDPYNDNASKLNATKPEKPTMDNNKSKPNAINPERSTIDDSFFEEDFDIDLEEVSKIENSHKRKNEPANVNTIQTEVKPTNVTNRNTYINFTETKIREEEQILDDDDCFLEMVDEAQFVETKSKQEDIPAPFRALPQEEDDDIIIIEEDVVANVSVSSKSDNIQHTLKNEKVTSLPSHEWFINKNNSSTTAPRSKLSENQKEILVTGAKRNIPISSPKTKPLKKGKIERSITEFIKPQNEPGTPKICEFIHDINRESITKTTFKTIRGHVEVLGKLTKKDSLWILECTVADGTGTLEVSFSNKVLEELLGFTVQEFSIKKKLKKNPKIEHQLRMSFRAAEHKIKTLDALLELELNSDTKPVVIKITDLTQAQKEIIDERLNNFLSKQ